MASGYDMPSIVIDRLVKKYGDVTAVDRLSLEVEYGELFGLLGPNGAGKTTTINVLCGLLGPTKGSIRVGGHEITKEPMEVKKIIGVCPQETAVYSYLTGRENVEFLGNLHAMSADILQKRSKDLLERLGLSEDANRRAGNYSSGMKRRLNIAMALIHDPQIVFLDEPTVGMDVQSRHAVWDFIGQFKTRGKTIVLTTHYMEEAEELCDRVGIIDYGKLIELDTPRNLNSKFQTQNLEEVFIKLTGRRIRSEE